MERVMRQLNNLYFELTGGCNLLCKHCYVFTTEKARERPDLLTPKLIETAVEEAMPYGLRTLTFTGGEIFLRKDLQDILDRCSRFRVKICLLTNLTLVKEDQVDWLATLPIQYVSTSIDGFEDDHDQFRGKSGAFTKTMETLTELRQAGVPVKVSITVGKHNIDYASELFAHFDTLSIPTSIARIASVGRGKLIDISDAELERRYTNLLAERLGRELEHACSDDFGAPGKDLETYCGVGDSILYVMSNGQVAYCPTLTAAQGDEWVVGDLLKQGLGQIWRSGAVFGDALQCQNIAVCEVGKLCRGGCRANAYARNGDVTACDSEMFDGISSWMQLRRLDSNKIIYLVT